MDQTIPDAAQELLDMDLSVIPVKKDKTPYIKWTPFQSKLPTPDEVEAWWEQWPEANVAIVTGDISGIYVVDADSPAGITWISMNLEKTGVYSLTSPGHLHAFYKIPPGVKVQNKVCIAPDVDIRGEGGYVVVPPSIHAGGHQYKWQFIMDGWDELTEMMPPDPKPGNLIVPPPVGSDKADNQVVGNMMVDTTGIKPPMTLTNVERGRRNDALARLAGRWIGKGLWDDEVLLLAQAWNQNNAPPLPDQEVRRTVISIQNTHVQNNPDDLERSEGLEPEETPVDAGADIPHHLLHPGGLLEDTMNFTEYNAPVSIPWFNLGAALTFHGCVMGQKVMTDTQLRTNLYAVVLGYSGSGKNAPFSVLPKLLAYSGGTSILGPTELTSPSSILNWLQNPGGRVCIFMLDELGTILQGLKKPQGTHMAGIPRMLTKLYSSTDRPEVKNYASGEAVMIPWHHLTLYGASTPEVFWDSLIAGDVTDGFLARILLFESLHPAPFPKTSFSFSRDEKLEKTISEILTMETPMDESRGNLECVPVPKTVPRTLAANQLLTDFALEYHDRKNDARKESWAPIYGRAAEQAAKIALIHAMSLDHHTGTVGVESVEWATSLMDYQCNYLVNQVRDKIHDNDVDKQKQRLIDGIRRLAPKNIRDPKKGYNGATVRDLMRVKACKGLKAREIKELFELLLISGEVGAKDVPALGNKGGRPRKVYFVSKQQD